MHQIAWFWTPKLKNLPTVGGRTPHSHTLPPARSLRSLRLGRFAPLPSLYNYFQCFLFTSIFMPESLKVSMLKMYAREGLRLHRVFFLERVVKSTSGPFPGPPSLSQKRIHGVTANQRLYNTRQESARKTWGLRTIVHEDWNGSEGALKHWLGAAGFIIKIKDNIIFIN